MPFRKDNTTFGREGDAFLVAWNVVHGRAIDKQGKPDGVGPYDGDVVPETIGKGRASRNVCADGVIDVDANLCRGGESRAVRTSTFSRKGTVNRTHVF